MTSDRSVLRELDYCTQIAYDPYPRKGTRSGRHPNRMGRRANRVVLKSSTIKSPIETLLPRRRHRPVRESTPRSSDVGRAGEHRALAAHEPDVDVVFAAFELRLGKGQDVVAGQGVLEPVDGLAGEQVRLRVEAARVLRHL